MIHATAIVLFLLLYVNHDKQLVYTGTAFWTISLLMQQGHICSRICSSL